jgi:predicted acyltransferase
LRLARAAGHHRRLLALYSVLMLFVPVPGIGAGVLAPGKDFGAWVDRMLLDGHLWVQSKTWDPEGLVSTHAGPVQPAVRRAGRALAGVKLEPHRANRVDAARRPGLLLAGHDARRVLMPINKSLWTPSYCLLTTGWALLFSAFYWLLDVNPCPRPARARGAWARPLVIYGMNALFMFAFSGFAAKMLGFIKLAQPDGSLKSLGRFCTRRSRLADRRRQYIPVARRAVRRLHVPLAWIMWRNKWFVKV